MGHVEFAEKLVKVAVELDGCETAGQDDQTLHNLIQQVEYRVHEDPYATRETVLLACGELHEYLIESGYATEYDLPVPSNFNA